MSILFNDLVFGPVNSRRFGVSLGINLLPTDNKLCNFNCVYCECGWTDLRSLQTKFPETNDVLTELERKFILLHNERKHFDAITFAGNGEPTMHPGFSEIIDKTIQLRNQFFPSVKIIVLSNSSLVMNEDIFKSLQKVDLRVMKLDAGSEELYQRIDQPLNKRSLNSVVEKLKLFNGDLYIQTMFLQGKHNGLTVDNTTEEEVNLWLEKLKQLNPKHIMLYTLDREPPSEQIQKVSKQDLDKICKQVISAGYSAKVYQ